MDQEGYQLIKDALAGLPVEVYPAPEPGENFRYLTVRMPIEEDFTLSAILNALDDVGLMHGKRNDYSRPVLRTETSSMGEIHFEDMAVLGGLKGWLRRRPPKEPFF